MSQVGAQLLRETAALVVTTAAGPARELAMLISLRVEAVAYKWRNRNTDAHLTQHRDYERLL